MVEPSHPLACIAGRAVPAAAPRPGRAGRAGRRGGGRRAGASRRSTVPTGGELTLAALPDAAQPRAHRAGHRRRADPPQRRRDLLLRPQLGVDVRGRGAAAAGAGRRGHRAWSTATCGGGSGGRPGCRCTGTSTPPRRSCWPRRPRTRWCGPPAGCPPRPATWLGVVGIGLAVRALRGGEHAAGRGGHRAQRRAVGRDRAGARELVGRWDDNALEVATICMGALAAVALSSAPGLVALVLPPILVLHRAVLVRQLEEVASTDAKTGLLNAAGLAQRRPPGRVLHRQRSRGAAARADPRPGPLQDGQRPLRAPRRRRGARRGGRRAAGRVAGRRTWSAGSAARSSWCCCATCRPARPAPTCCSRWPSGSGGG